MGYRRRRIRSYSAPSKPRVSLPSDWQDHVVYYPTVSAFIDQSCDGRDANGDQFWQGVTEYEESFYGVKTPAQARELATHGWPEGRAIIEAQKAHIDKVLGSTHTQYVPEYDITGSYPDVARFVEGIPECMMSFVEVPNPNSGFVWIHFSAGVTAGVSNKHIQMQGAVCGALIDALEAGGKRVRLTWERSSKQTGSITLWFELKGYDEPLEMDRLAFFLCHNAPRRCMAWNCYMAENMGPSLGVEPGNCECRPFTHASVTAQSDIQINHPEWYDESAATKWMIDKLAEFGIKFDGAFAE